MSKSPIVFKKKNQILHGGPGDLMMEIKTIPIHNFPGTLNEWPHSSIG